MSIEKEIDRLESLILDSPRLPLGRTLVNEEEALDILDRIRINLPTALTEADSLLKTRDAILAQARQQATALSEQSRQEGEKALELAKQEAIRYLDESELVRAAEREAAQVRTQALKELENYQRQAEDLREKTRLEAERILKEARAQAQQTEEEADLYAEKVLARLEGDLDRIMQVVRSGRQQLKKKA